MRGTWVALIVVGLFCAGIYYFHNQLIDCEWTECNKAGDECVKNRGALIRTEIESLKLQDVQNIICER